MSQLQQLKGISSIINPDNVAQHIDVDNEIKLFMNNKPPTANTDPAEIYKDELMRLSKEVGVDLSPFQTANIEPRQTPHMSPHTTPHMSPHASPQSGFESPEYSNHQSPNEEDDYDSEDERTPTSNMGYDSIHLSPQPLSSAMGSGMQSNIATPTMNYAAPTQEQIYQNQINSVMNDLGGNMADNNTLNLDSMKREDTKMSMLETIDSIRASLEEEDALGLDRIPKVTQESSYDDVEHVLRRLQLKNDRARYTSLADEFLLLGADAMEELFDGQNMYFNRYRPDLRGWRKEVQVKLRRMRHDTSTLVSDIMHDYNIGPGARILLELIPNMVMFANRRRSEYGQVDMIGDNMNEEFEKLRNI